MVSAPRWNKTIAPAFSGKGVKRMGDAIYAIVAVGEKWGVFHDGMVEGDYLTKESAFEAAA